MSLKVARYYEIEKNGIKCILCPHKCLIKQNDFGKCQARENIEGILYANNYGKIVSIALDPIEKKPLKMFYQGSKILSVGTYGCNLKCNFCQNWQISQNIVKTVDFAPRQLVDLALKEKDNGNIGIAYTYNEPFIWYEYIYDVAKLAKENGLLNVLVSNGYINIDPLRELVNYIDAINIDVKSFNQEFYKKICCCNIDNVLRNVEYLWDKCHLEITTLVIPTLNDSEKEIENLSRWISEMSDGIPLHLSRYFPRYKMDIQCTPIETLKRLKNVALKYLKNVYIGNI